MTDTDTAETPGENSINDGAGLEIADPNDWFHRRDDEDELQPVLQKVPGRDAAMRVIPPTGGDYERYDLDNESALYADNELFAEFCNEFFPDLDGEVTADDVENGLIAFGAEPMVDMVKRAGGKDMKEAMDERDIEMMMKYLGDSEGNIDLEALVEAGQNVDEDEE